MSHLDLESGQLDKIKEPFSILRTALFFKNNFVVEFEPVSSQTKKVPDLFVKELNNDVSFYVEISEFNDSDETNTNSSQIGLLFSSFQRVELGVHVFGKLLKSLSKEESQTIYSYLKTNLLKKTHNDGVFRYYVPGSIDIVAYQSSHRAEVEKLAKQNDLIIDGISGPEERSELFRLPGKIAAEQMRLTEGSDNVIVIWSMSILVELMNHNTSISEIITKIISDLSSIAGIIIAAEFPNDSFKTNTNDEIVQIENKNGMFYSFMLSFKNEKSSIKKKVFDSILSEAVDTPSIPS